MNNRWILSSLFAAALAACSSTPRGSTTTPATTPAGTPVTTSTGTAVNERANNVFGDAATAMRTHDEANEGRGDWTADTCTAVARQFEAAANAQANGNFAEAWFNRGLVFSRCNQADQARQSFQRALQAANGNFCRAKVQLGVMAYQANDIPAARTAFEEAIAADRSHCVEGYTNLAMLLRRQNPTTDAEWQNVVRNIRAALALDDRYLPARNELALSYLQQAGDDPNSQRVFLAGLVCTQAVQVGQQSRQELTPDVRGFLADLFNTWGLVDIRRGEIIKALEHFRRAYTLNPTMFEALMNYGTINLSFRGYADARTAFEAALALRADSYDAHIGLGVALRGLAQTNEAEHDALITRANEEYTRARTLDEARPDAHYNLGLLHMSYMGGQIPALRQALEHFAAFRQRATAPRWARNVTQTQQNERNIRDTITALEAVGPQATGGAAPATPPAAGATPPAAPATPATPAAPAAQ
ncbi:MAG: tetratricopeptide repeat protein [Myxococcales bacterium]|nr:tetratricopeptide repeat protein [Myxococcales bacterium]